MSEIQAELELLKKSNAFKDILFSIIGHDLKSPFNNIKGFLSLLEDNLLTEKERNETIKQLKDTIDNSVHTLDNLLGWASQNYFGNKLNIKTKNECLNLHELVNRAIIYHQNTALKKSLTILNNIPLQTYVNTDLEQLSFILRNLIGNAIKFSYEKTVIHIDSVNNDKMVEIAVVDQGIGISENCISALFQIEKRSSSEGTFNEKGSGLALILCKEFVENNRGKIWVESEEAKGTTVKFTVSLFT